MAKRYTLSEIGGVTDSYKATPQGDVLGQVVFALNTATGSTCIGQCVFGCQLIPWGICCYFNPNVNSACACPGSTVCGFCLSGTGIFLALGSVTGCGATLFRRIA